MVSRMNIDQILNILKETECKTVISEMFRTLLTMNDQIPNPPTIEYLTNTIYSILIESGFDTPSVWEDEVYSYTINKHKNLKVSDLITASRNIRSKRIAKIICDTGILPKSTILDYGVGSGMNMVALLNNYNTINIHGYDPNNYVCTQLINSNQYTHVNNSKNLKPNYDLVILSWVLHHTDPKTHADILNHIHQCLSPSGKFLFIETLTKAPEDNDPFQYYEAIAALKDSISGRGMVPTQAYTGTRIFGYHTTEAWIKTLKEAGFILLQAPSLMPQSVDEFTEFSVSFLCQKAGS